MLDLGLMLLLGLLGGGLPVEELVENLEHLCGHTVLCYLSFV